MNTVFLILIITNILLFIGVLVVYQKFTKPPQEDPRLSKGLQLLQSKISILEDLSDRTDVQIKQLMTLLDQKIKQVQQKLHDSELQMQKIEQSMLKSLEVAEIFQDKIPHEEIIERQNSVKYIQAAQLAYQGHSVDEIVEIVDLPKGEVEFIVKVNKDELMFDVENLPDWAKKSLDSLNNAGSSSEFIIENFKSHSNDINQFEVPNPNLDNLQKLGDDFKAACEKHDQEVADYELKKQQPSEIAKVAQKVKTNIVETANDWIEDSKALINERLERNEHIEKHEPLERNENIGKQETLEKKSHLSGYNFETKEKMPLDENRANFKLKDVFSQTERALAKPNNLSGTSTKIVSSEPNNTQNSKFDIKPLDMKPLSQDEKREGPETEA